MNNHGGNVYEIERNLNIQKNEIIDFSSNINPLGISRCVKKLLKKNINIMTRYPDPEYFCLKNKIADFYKIDPDLINMGNGATEILSLYFRVISPKKALIISPTFSEYENALLITGAQINHFRLLEDEKFKPDIERLILEIRNGYDVIVMCNPNNPTGNVIKVENIERLLFELKKFNTSLFIDESFMDFLDDMEFYSAIGLIDKYRNLFILKSLTKFFAIPGIRLGFSICADQNLVDKIKSIQYPWPINCFADLAGCVLFDDKDYIMNTKKFVNNERAVFYNALKKNQNLKIFESKSNFFLIKLLNGLTVPELQSCLLKEKILIRDCSNFKFLNDKFFRIAVKTRKENEYIVKKLFPII